MPRVATSEAAAPAAKLAEKVRLFIMSVTPSRPASVDRQESDARDHRRLNEIDYTFTGTVSKPPLSNWLDEFPPQAKEQQRQSVGI
jgi:hypothetical protein